MLFVFHAVWPFVSSTVCMDIKTKHTDALSTTSVWWSYAKKIYVHTMNWIWNHKHLENTALDTLAHCFNSHFQVNLHYLIAFLFSVSEIIFILLILMGQAKIPHIFFDTLQPKASPVSSSCSLHWNASLDQSISYLCSKFPNHLNLPFRL